MKLHTTSSSKYFFELASHGSKAGEANAPKHSKFNKLAGQTHWPEASQSAKQSRQCRMQQNAFAKGLPIIASMQLHGMESLLVESVWPSHCIRKGVLEVAAESTGRCGAERKGHFLLHLLQLMSCM